MNGQIQSAAQPCPCGCADCDKTCCNLDCLVQPRFFCGQLLTDRDLTALVTWTSDKFRLARYRDGWGVVCGLELRRDPTQPGRVVVDPGYAISCCGDDIVVCEAAPLDLAAACHIQDECADPWGKATQAAAVAGRAAAAAPYSLSGALQDAVAVDVFVAYQGQPTDPQVSLVRNGCNDFRDCEYSRTREGFRLYAIEASPAPQAANGGQPQGSAQSPAATAFVAAWGGVKLLQGDAARGWLQNWIARYPLHSFAFVAEWINQSQANDLSGGNLVRILLWMLLDYRNQGLACACGNCEAEQGVPLGRVWVGKIQAGLRQECRVLAVSGFAPHRRSLSRGCPPPAPPGGVDLGEVLWQPPDAVSALLAARGITATVKPIKLDAFDDVDALANCGPLVAGVRDVQVAVLDDAFPGQTAGAQLVIGLCPAGTFQ